MAKHKYISQDAAIDAVDVCNLHRGIIDALQAIISDIPTADVRPVVKAAWEDTPNPQWPAYDIRHCPCCGWSIPKSKLRAKDLDWNYCPNCGADMREPNLDTTKGDSHD